MWNNCLKTGWGRICFAQHCTHYYYPVKSSCCFEKIGGVFCQPHHNVGVLVIFKTEETHEATLNLVFGFFVFPPQYILFNYTLETNKVLKEFPGFGCKLCGLSLSSQNRSFPLHGQLHGYFVNIWIDPMKVNILNVLQLFLYALDL